VTSRAALGRAASLLVATALTGMTSPRGVGAPRVFLLDASHLSDVRERIHLQSGGLSPPERGDRGLAAAWAALRADADEALSPGPFSVTDKSIVPPSGDKHDYLSQAPYWWPNPKAADGLPYVRRDGERNPEIDRISNHRAMDRMTSAVETLALAAYLGGDERHASKAAQLLRAWFVDPATRMNPHLEYAQGIPGINTGRGIGLIESRGLTRVVDAVGLLESTTSWGASDGQAVRAWFERFLGWMRESRHGQDEAAAKNNHGTYYDLQVASFALFVDRADLARAVVGAAREKRLAVQVEPDGRQPFELARTRSWSYSVMNVDGLTQLAILGERVGVDLWGYPRGSGAAGSSDPARIRAALLYLAPYALGERKWPHQQITEWTPRPLFPVLRRAAARYRDAEFTRVMSKVPPRPPAERNNLLAR
jgi:hypothetical protein